MRISGLLAIIALALCIQGQALANIPACCLPDGSCEHLLVEQCDDRDGASVVGASCASQPCNVMAPVVSPTALVVLATALLAIAIYALMRRRSPSP